MTKSRSATVAAVLLCFLLALTLSGCGKSSSAASTTTTTTASNIEMAVAAGNQQVTVSWTDPSSTSTSNATYNVYYSTTPFDETPKNDTTTHLIASGVTSPFVHTGLINGNTYYYFVTRVTGSTDGPASRYAAAVPQAATPAVPTGITIATGIQQSSGAITLTIPNADSSLKYNVYWAANSTATKAGNKIADAFTYNSSTKAASFTHYNRTNDGSVAYHYVVTAEDESESDVSKELSVTPHVSTSVTTSPNYTFASVDSVTAAVANQQATLTWTAPDNVNSVSPIYNVYCTATNQTETKIAANLSGTTFIHNGLTNDSTYTYRVTAVYKDSNVTTESTTWTSISVVPQAKVLATPSAVAASKTGDQQVSLSWGAVSDPAGGTVKYNIYYTNTLPTTNTTTQALGGWKLAGTTTATSFVHSGLTIGDTYYYVITSVSDQSGESTATWTSSQVSMEL